MYTESNTGVEDNLKALGIGETGSLPLTVVFEKGLEAIWADEENAEFQTEVLTSIVQHTRSVPDDLVEETVEYLKQLGAFYVPNDEYMLHYFGHEIKQFGYGMYYSGGQLCKYYKRLAIPLRYLDGTLIGFCGYSDGSSEGEDPNGADHVKYLYPPKAIFKKENYAFIEREELERSIKEGYVMITDGLFDKITLQVQGYNAISLCGSALTEYHKLCLSTVKHKIILPDNDKAGIAMANKCKREMKKTIVFKQGDEWDADDWLKTTEGQKELYRLFSQAHREGYRKDLTAKRKRSVQIIELPNEEITTGE